MIDLLPPDRLNTLEELRNWCNELYRFLQYPHFGQICLSPVTEPPVHEEGSVYYDSTGHTVKAHDAAGWEDIPAATTDALPADSVVEQVTFGLAHAEGAADTWSRSDHAHGTPPDPFPAMILSLHVDYADSLEDAIDDIANDPVELWIDADTSTDTKTCPVNIYLRVLNDCLITVNAGETLTIYSPANIIAAPNQKIFSLTGNGTVVFSVGGIDYPEWWGIDGTDDHVQIQNAYDALPTGIVQLSSTTYYVTDTINVDTNRVSIHGRGPQASVISFTPAVAGDACIYVSKGAAVAYQNQLKNFAINGTGVAKKIGIKASDTSWLLIEDIAMLTMTGGDSIGIQLMGREFTQINRCRIRADIPISIEGNPNSTIDCDLLSIRDIGLGATTGYACIQIADGVNLTNFSIDGSNDFDDGKYGIYWVDTTTTAVSSNMTLKNIRMEGMDTDGYQVYISHNYNLQNVLLENIWGGLGNGFYFRKILHLSLKNVYYGNATSKEALNIDETTYPVKIDNCFWNTGTTFSLGNLITAYEITEASFRRPRHALYRISWYQSAGGADYYYPMMDGVRINGVAIFEFTETLADDAYTKYLVLDTPSTATFIKTEVMAYVSSTGAVEGGTALDYNVNGVATVSAGGTANFAVSDSDTDICVIRVAADTTKYRIRNRLGNEAIVHVKCSISF